LTAARGRRKLSPETPPERTIADPASRSTEAALTPTAIKRIAFAVVLVVAFLVMRVTGTGFGDLWQLAQGEFEQTRAEIREYRTGEYTDPLARQLRTEAARMSPAQTASGLDAELRDELQGERQRIMQEHARNAEKIGSQVLKGDTEVLKRQVRDNAQKSAGSY
jgi:hypothetical protein